MVTSLWSRSFGPRCRLDDDISSGLFGRLVEFVAVGSGNGDERVPVSARARQLRRVGEPGGKLQHLGRLVAGSLGGRRRRRRARDRRQTPAVDAAAAAAAAAFRSVLVRGTTGVVVGRSCEVGVSACSRRLQNDKTL